VGAGSGRLWTSQAIQDDIVVKWDPVTGVVSGVDQIRRGFVKRDDIAWVGAHRHSPAGNEPYIASYLFAYAIDVPAGIREIRLPTEERLRILAISAVREPAPVRPAGPLYASELPEPRR
jgi:alpha-mannosidase